jgi:hypothetical protein
VLAETVLPRPCVMGKGLRMRCWQSSHHPLSPYGVQTPLVCSPNKHISVADRQTDRSSVPLTQQREKVPLNQTEAGTTKTCNNFHYLELQRTQSVTVFQEGPTICTVDLVPFESRLNPLILCGNCKYQVLCN